MPDPDVTMTVHHPEPGTAVIEIAGDVTAAVLSSTVPPLVPTFVHVCTEYFGVEPLVIGTGVRTGVREITVVKSPALSGGGLLATLSPVTLPQSRQMRLARLYKGATYRDEQHELRLPVKGGASLADDLVAALGELVPDVAPAVEA